MDFQIWMADGMEPFTVAIGLMLLITLLEVVSALLGVGVSSVLDSLIPDSWAADMDVDAGSTLSNLLGWFLIGRVPLLMLLIVFLTAFGLFGYGIQATAHSLFGVLLPGGLASIPAVLLSLPVLRGFGRLFLRWFPVDASDAPNREGLIGRVAVVFRGEANRGNPAEAKVTDGAGATHYLLVEPDGEGETFRAGDHVLIVRQIGAHYAAILNPHAVLSQGETP